MKKKNDPHFQSFILLRFMTFSFMPIIELKNLHKAFGWHTVLNGVSLAVEEGKCLVIIGGQRPAGA